MDDSPELLQRVSLVYLASYPGISPETLSRAKKVKYLMVGGGNYEKLTQITKWVEEAELKPSD